MTEEQISAGAGAVAAATSPGEKSFEKSCDKSFEKSCDKSFEKKDEDNSPSESSK